MQKWITAFRKDFRKYEKLRILTIYVILTGDDRRRDLWDDPARISSGSRRCGGGSRSRRRRSGRRRRRGRRRRER